MNEASEEFRVQCPDDFNCIEKWLCIDTAIKMTANCNKNYERH